MSGTIGRNTAMAMTAASVSSSAEITEPAMTSSTTLAESQASLRRERSHRGHRLDLLAQGSGLGVGRVRQLRRLGEVCVL